MPLLNILLLAYCKSFFCVFFLISQSIHWLFCSHLHYKPDPNFADKIRHVSNPKKCISIVWGFCKTKLICEPDKSAEGDSVCCPICTINKSVQIFFLLCADMSCSSALLTFGIISIIENNWCFPDTWWWDEPHRLVTSPFT